MWLERSPACNRDCQKHGTNSRSELNKYAIGPRLRGGGGVCGSTSLTTGFERFRVSARATLNMFTHEASVIGYTDGNSGRPTHTHCIEWLGARNRIAASHRAQHEQHGGDWAVHHYSADPGDHGRTAVHAGLGVGSRTGAM